ncbi:MAG: glycoside hydrolase family 16 protein [Saprospiraceae bacterium]|nr:glycoside hydrolase family 16 protein [Saprospiraceae bacterium]
MKISNKYQFFTLLLAGLFWGCETDDVQKLENRNWTLTWSDEFEGEKDQAPDPTKWTYDLGTGQNGWGNNEYQTYTQRPENVGLDGGGNLVITALNQPFGGANFSSARIKTQGLFTQKYGRFEARIKSPYGPGIWPAFWMLGENINEVSWPQCGEIDIMELRGQAPSTMYGTLHGPGYSGGNAVSKNYSLTNARFDNDFYLYAVEWDENKIDFFVNNYLYGRITKEDVPGEWVYDQPFYMILNVAVGGNFVGFPTSQTPFPQQMVIDFVRVYQKSN